jgi:hypothetical protein
LHSITSQPSIFRSLRVCNLSEGVNDCCCKVSVQSLKFQILENIKEFPQGVRAEVFLKTRVVEEAQRNLCFKTLEEGAETLACWWTNFVKAYLPISQKTFRRHLTVRILHGGFAKSQKLSDLTEEKGSYDSIRPVQDRENQTVGYEPIRGRQITHIFRISGSREVKGRNLCSETHKIEKVKSQDRKGI